MKNNIPLAIEMYKIADMYDDGHEYFSQREQKLNVELEEAVSDILDKIEKAANNGKGFVYYDMSLIRNCVTEKIIEEFKKQGYSIHNRSNYIYMFGWIPIKE